MPYEKIVWKSGKTKLSARNFNHMEDGISVADENATAGLVLAATKQNKLTAGANITIVNDTISATVADAPVKSVNTKTGDVVLKTSDLENDSNYVDETELATKQDKLISGTNIKTINAQSILGAGNIEIQGGESTAKYKEYTDPVSLDLITDSGVYKIVSATDAPAGTASDGLLEVKKLVADDSTVKTEQEWLSSTNRAIRVLGAGTSLHFYVNDEEKPQGTITLAAGGTYTLSGDLLGHIEIGTSADTPVCRTKIILKGVNIQSADYEAAIRYLPSTKKLTVELEPDTENYLVMSKVAEKGDDDLGALHSDNDMLIQGVGYLTIKNNKGHGIKASELRIQGNPHIYLDTKHDAVHGGKLLKITGGSFKVVDANDAFSSSAGSSNDGKMSILGGEYNIIKCAQSAFDGKSTAGTKQIMNAQITFGVNVNELFTSPNGFKIYTGFNDITNETTKTLPDTTNLESMYETPSIVTGETVIDCTPALIELNVLADTEYTIKGNFTGHKIVVNAATNVKADFIVKNLYYNNTDANDTDPFITHNSTTKRIKFKFDVENSLSYLYKKAGAVFKTGRSIQLTSKGDSIISCPEGYAIYAKDGYVVLGGDGLRKIEKSKFGVYSTSIRLGEDPEDVLDGTKYGISDAAIYIADSTENDVIISNDTGTSIAYPKQIIATQYFGGCAILNKVVADTSVTGNIIAMNGNVKQSSTTVEYANTALVYIQDTEVLKNEHVKDYVAPTGFKESIPELTPGNTWKVYTIPTNIYTKAEVDANFVAKTTYEALAAQVEKLTPKTISFTDITGVTGIDKVKIYRFASSENLDDQPVTLKIETAAPAKTKARDGDFGDILSDGDGQVNFKLVTPEGAKVAVSSYTILPEDGFKNFKTPSETGIAGLYRITKVSKDLTVSLVLAETYDVEYITGKYQFDSNPTEVAQGVDLEFKIAHNTGTAPTEEAARAFIESITSNSVDVTNQLIITNLGKNKVTYKLPATAITGKIVVTGKAVE